MFLAADLFCGLGGWTEGLLSEGWQVRGYDIEEHVYGDDRYPGEFIQRDILEMHGREIADVDLIVSSSPCQAYSYMAMPWTRAKAKAAVIRADETGQALRDLNMLFDAQFRIQREASEAAGRYIPMVVENVRGARPWVTQPSRGNYGSFYLWGDVPPNLPKPVKARKNGEIGGGSWFAVGSPGQTKLNGNPDGRKVSGFRFDGSGGSFQTASVQEGRKHSGDWFRDPTCPTRQGGQVKTAEGRKAPGETRWFNDGPRTPESLASSSNSAVRKAASAKIAKIPFALSSYIARYYAAKIVLS